MVHFPGASGSGGGGGRSQPEPADQPEPDPPTIPTRAGKSIRRLPLIIQVKPEDIAILFGGPEQRRPEDRRPLLPPMRKRGGSDTGMGGGETLLPMPMVSGSFTPRWGNTAAPATLVAETMPSDVVRNSGFSGESRGTFSARSRVAATDRIAASKPKERSGDRQQGNDSRLLEDSLLSDDDEDDGALVVGDRDAGDSGGSDDSVVTAPHSDTTTTLREYDTDGGIGDDDTLRRNDNVASNDLRSLYDDDRGEGGEEEDFSAVHPPPAITDTTTTNNTDDSDDDEPIGGETPRAEASNDAPANFLVSDGGQQHAASVPDGAEEEGRSLDIARSGLSDHAHRIIISQHILRETGGDFGGGGSSGGLTLQIGSQGGSSRAVLDISNMVGIAVGILGFLLIVCGKHAADCVCLRVFSTRVICRPPEGCLYL